MTLGHCETCNGRGGVILDGGDGPEALTCPTCEGRSRFFRARFAPGLLRVTPGARALLAAADDGRGPELVAADLVCRHLQGDWCDPGGLDAEDLAANETALAQGLRVLSLYQVAGERLYIITEADRSATTLLRPEEY